MVRMKMMHSEIWQELETRASTETGIGTLKRMIGTKKICPMFIGINRPGNMRVFILEVPRENLPSPNRIPDSNGFDFKLQIVGDETNQDHISLILYSASSKYDQIFASISSDLFINLNELTNAKEIVSKFLNRLQLWQSFFQKQNSDGLSEEAQKGLYGELFFIKKYVFPKFEPMKSLSYWLGTNKRQHDFQFGDLSVEVKTTSSKQHQKLHISSEQQLDDSLVNQLYLFFLSVSLIDNLNQTLPSLIGEIREFLTTSTAALERFNSILIERGYLDIHRHLYESTGYSLRKSGFFQVHSDFPRITEHDLRPGVGNIKYTIDLDMCAPFSVSENDFVTNLERLVI